MAAPLLVTPSPRFAPKKLSDLELLFAQIIWGLSGAGKTSLAATAPGAKLWLLFDPGGCDSIRNRDDIYVMDFTSMPDSTAQKFKEGDPFGIVPFLKDHPDVQTIVFDSITTFGEMALRHGVKDAATTVKTGQAPTMEDPGKPGYGRRKTWTEAAVWNTFRIAKENNCNVIFLFHEDIPDRDKEGNIINISMMVGGNLAEQIPIKFNEVWHLRDTGKERRISIRPNGLRRPMKSRMFITSGAGDFVWSYDADTNKGEGIADWYAKWRAAGRKVPVPA